MIEQYYTPEQLETFRRRREEAAAAGVDIAKQGQEAWAKLYEDVRVLVDEGVDPSDPRAQALEARRQALVQSFTGGDKGIEESLKRLWTEQGDKLCAQFGINAKLQAYLHKVAEAAPKK